tara:strand:+ start:3541 stop:4023 length:483 start_codon:yes stop_codon:yes gene_type:complete
MDYIIHMYDRNQYDSYDLALADAAITATDDAYTVEKLDHITDTMTIIESAMSCIGYAPTSIVLGIVKQGVFIPFESILDMIRSNRTNCVGHAIDFVYQDLAMIVITLTIAEATELTHRINCANAPFAEAYTNDRYTSPMKSTNTSKLFHKLNNKSRTFNL